MNFTVPVESESELLFLIAGVILLIGGWLIFKLGSRLLGVALGAGFGFFLGEVLNVILKIDRDTGLYITIGCSFLGAIAAIFMIRAVTNFLFALIGFLFGALIGRLGYESYASYQQIEFAITAESGIIILAAAGICALLAVWLQRLIMILITCYMGATFLAGGLTWFETRPWGFPALFLGGIIWQAFILGRIFDIKPRGIPRRLENDTR